MPRNWQEALPPWHTTALIVLLLAIFTARIPDRLAAMDQNMANHVMHTNFPELLTIRQVGLIRLMMGSVIMMDTIYAFFYGKWDQDTEYYYPYSRLQVVRGIPFRGYFASGGGSLSKACMTMSSFTMWSWVVQGTTFMMLGGMTLYLDTHPNHELSIWLYRAVMIGWKICAPASFLVSAIVKYILWPLALEAKSNGPGTNNANVLKHPLALLEHNWNVLSALVEVALLGGLPIRYQDFVWAPLFGLVYVLYSYAMMYAWVSPKFGPQYIYPFLDSTMGWLTSVCLLALLGVLMLSFGIFYALDYFITEILPEGNVWSHVASVVAIGLCVCRFCD